MLLLSPPLCSMLSPRILMRQIIGDKMDGSKDKFSWVMYT